MRLRHFFCRHDDIFRTKDRLVYVECRHCGRQSAGIPLTGTPLVRFMGADHVNERLGEPMRPAGTKTERVSGPPTGGLALTFATRRTGTGG